MIAQVSIGCCAVALSVAMTGPMPCLCRERPCMDAQAGQAGMVFGLSKTRCTGMPMRGDRVPGLSQGAGLWAWDPWSRQICLEAEEEEMESSIPCARRSPGNRQNSCVRPEVQISGWMGSMASRTQGEGLGLHPMRLGQGLTACMLTCVHREALRAPHSPPSPAFPEQSRGGFRKISDAM